jgi:Ca2+-binding RTX toxin-like protein
MQEEDKKEVSQQRKQKKLFSTKSPQISLAVLFTGLILMIAATISAPIVVFAANIDGTPGDDTLNGTPKADTINGFDGNDKLFGKAGNDALDGGNGDDEIYGGPGNDNIKDANDEAIHFGNKVYGGSGNDNVDARTVTGTGITYYIYGEAGSDYIQVSANEGYVNGGPGEDTIYCAAQYCALQGDGGHDTIHIEPMDIENYASGGSGNDKIFSAGHGALYGNEGNDYLDNGVELYGGEGYDVLEAGRSGSYFIGGPGADTFRCSPGPYDEIKDYNPEEGDKIVNIEDCETVEGT